MYKVIEGIYERGKIIVPQLPDVKDKTKVIIAFEDQTSHTEKKSSTRHKGISLDLPKNLEEIDVSISTANKYRAQLTKASKEKRERKDLQSPFFSSPPVDLGYTDASMLDTIIAEDKINGNIS
jgi:hypothetical protein